MFYWMKGGSSFEPLDSVGNMSKSDILRGIITEKLSTAAREILAVVERTVADYEEEAAGFRQEIGRQRRQLQLLQPQVKLERRELFPDLQSHVVVMEARQEEQPMQQPDVEDTGSPGPLLCDNNNDEEEGVEMPVVQLEMSSTQNGEHLKELDHQIPARLFSLTVQSDRKKPSRGTHNHLDFRIRILEDVPGNVLSNSVFKNSPVQHLKCPRGLQETDFLDLLRSTFPQLTNEEHIHFFISSTNRLLQPLEVKSLTPEEIYQAIRSAGNSALYIRLKFEGKRPSKPLISDIQTHLDFRIRILEDSETDMLSNLVFKKYPVQDLRCPRGLQEADFLELLRSTFPQLAADERLDFFIASTNRRLQPLEVESRTPEEIYKAIRSAGHSALYIRLKKQDNDSATMSADQTEHNTRGLSDRRKTNRRLISDTQTHLDFRIRILEDSKTDMLSNIVFEKCPVQDLRCPRGLQEADFLELLRSTFPQLAADERLDFFIASTNRRLQPLEVESRTPEEIYKAIRSAGHSALYIRLKKQDDEIISSSVTTSADQTEHNTRAFSPRGLSDRKKINKPLISDTQTHLDFRIRILEDCKTDMLSNIVFKKCPVQDLRCPRGLQEADFLELLRSTFPQLAADKPLDFFIASTNKRLQPLEVESRTPEEIYKAIRSAGHSALYIRLKKGEEEEEELHFSVTNVDSPSTDAEAIRSDKAGLHSSSPVQHVDGTAVDVLASSSTSQNQDLQTEEHAADSEVDSSDDMNEDEVLDGDDEWKPDPKLQLPKTKKKQVLKSSVKRLKSKMPCKVCGVSYTLLGSLIKHTWSHVDEPQNVCGVCGKTLDSVEELKEHLQNYQKTHDCSVCGKSFYSVDGLKKHTSCHTGNRPFKCNVCSKTFPRMSVLRVHRWIHVEEKPYKCDICLKSFGLKVYLTAHTKAHTRRETYHCNICGKSVSDQRSLSRHKLTHTEERQYGCQVCGKRFKLPSTLKTHEKIHTVRDQSYLCHICSKTFMSNGTLKAHLRTHSTERPFICATCNKGFGAKAELKKHLRVHTGEAPYGCTTCGRFFKQRAALNSHVKSRHLGIRQFVCEICGKVCSRKAHLKIHMRTHNGDRPYQCTLCEKAFTQSHCLKSHMKSHQAEENSFPHQSTR